MRNNKEFGEDRGNVALLEKRLGRSGPEGSTV
jgi:hypothetical protein